MKSNLKRELEVLALKDCSNTLKFVNKYKINKYIFAYKFVNYFKS